MNKKLLRETWMKYKQVYNQKRTSEGDYPRQLRAKIYELFSHIYGYLTQTQVKRIAKLLEVNMTYKEKLEKEGIANTRTQRIVDALDTLHGALCRLDTNGSKIFFSKSIKERLNEYAKKRGMWEFK